MDAAPQPAMERMMVRLSIRGFLQETRAQYIYQPLTLYRSSHTLFAKDSSIVTIFYDIMWQVAKDRQQTKRAYLVVLDGKVVACSLKMSGLHKEAGNYRLPNVEVVVGGIEFSRDQGQVEAAHDAGQLRAHVVSRLE